MIYDLLTDTFFNNLKKKVTMYVAMMIFFAVVIVLCIILTFVLQNRETMMWFVFGSTFICSLCAGFMSFLWFSVVNPQRKILTLIYNAERSHPKMNEVKISQINRNFEIYEGFDVCKIEVIDGELNKTLHYYLLADYLKDLIEQKNYRIAVFNRVIVKIEEI